jgi:hypothetical protein
LRRVRKAACGADVLLPGTAAGVKTIRKKKQLNA